MLDQTLPVCGIQSPVYEGGGEAILCSLCISWKCNGNYVLFLTSRAGKWNLKMMGSLTTFILKCFEKPIIFKKISLSLLLVGLRKWPALFGILQLLQDPSRSWWEKIATQPLCDCQIFSPNRTQKTIIFYNHYDDTVPADGDQPWTGDRFTLSEFNLRDHVRSRVAMMTEDISAARLTALQKNTFVKVAICQSVSPCASRGGRGVTSTDLDDKYLAKQTRIKGGPLSLGTGTRNNPGSVEHSVVQRDRHGWYGGERKGAGNWIYPFQLAHVNNVVIICVVIDCCETETLYSILTIKPVY